MIEIKPPTSFVDESKKKQKTCSICATILKYTPSDVVVLWEEGNYSGGTDGAKGFRCPRCGYDVVTERW